MPRIALGLALVGLVACDGSRTTVPPTSIVGAYQLKTLQGYALPFTTQSGTTITQLVADQLTVNTDGTWREAASYLIAAENTVTAAEAGGLGVYMMLNGQVQFTQTAPSASTFRGSVRGDTLTIQFNGTALVYQR